MRVLALVIVPETLQPERVPFQGGARGAGIQVGERRTCPATASPTPEGTNHPRSVLAMAGNRGAGRSKHDAVQCGGRAAREALRARPGPSAESFGRGADDARWAAEVAKPIDVSVLGNLAEELGTTPL